MKLSKFCRRWRWALLLLLIWRSNHLSLLQRKSPRSFKWSHTFIWAPVKREWNWRRLKRVMVLICFSLERKRNHFRSCDNVSGHVVRSLIELDPKQKKLQLSRKASCIRHVSCLPSTWYIWHDFKDLAFYNTTSASGRTPTDCSWAILCTQK